MEHQARYDAKLIPATLADYSVIQNMARFYVYDISRSCGFTSHEWACPKNGMHECSDLKIYFTEENRQAFLIKVGEELAGFVLLRKQNKEEKVCWEISEFFVFGKFQGKGIGEQIAQDIWKQFPGFWQLSIIPENTPAYGFWKYVIAKYTNQRFTESVEKVDFDKHQPNRIIFRFKSSPYHLRPATLEDTADIVSVQIKGWKHAYKGILDQEYLDNICPEKRLAGRINYSQKESFWGFVAEYEGKIIGMCDAGFSRHPQFGKGEIFALYVDQEHQRKGVGKLLWNATTKKLQEEKLLPYIVIALEKNLPARKFYEKLGGSICGNVKTEINGKFYDEIVYRYDV